MRTIGLVAAMTVAGVLGGVAGALLVGGGPAPGGAASGAATEPREAAPRATGDGGKEMRDLQARVEVLEANLGNTATETSRLREELAAEKKAAAEARERLASLERTAASFAAPGLPQPLGPGRVLNLDGGSFQIAGREAAGPFAERFKRMAELRALPIDERWQKARDALGLTVGQEEELKAALKERDDTVRDALKVAVQEPRDGSGGAVTVTSPDVEKMREARRKYDDRVSQALNADQAKKWKDEGYEGALGGGERAVISSIRVDTGTEGK